MTATLIAIAAAWSAASIPAALAAASITRSRDLQRPALTGGCPICGGYNPQHCWLCRGGPLIVLAETERLDQVEHSVRRAWLDGHDAIVALLLDYLARRDPARAYALRDLTGRSA